MAVDKNVVNNARDTMRSEIHRLRGLQANVDIADLWLKLEEGIPSLQEQYDQIKADFETVFAERNAVLQELKDLEPKRKERDGLDRQIAERHAEKEQLERQVDERKKHIKALDDEISSKTKRSKDLNAELVELHGKAKKFLSAAE